ncbi:hypothetical protein MPL3365_130560 [Mesorhizobium plurifarium]|uniref:Carbon monoxide dehydrogenase subunit G n=1 Tax=Mesorhizobium plurifarium TaxID=69974 RepID=A0A090FX66_MESPL|nr:hypothetical protein MPL3365_130560 [Mesorhizobium plurifarium]
MKVSLEIDVAAPPEQVWKALADVPLIASCVPGASLLGTTEDGRYRGKVTTRVGPVSANFTGEAALDRNGMTRSGRVVGSGRDSITSSSAKAEMEFRVRTGTEPGRTRLEVDSEITLAGVLAQFGKAAVVNEIARRIAEQFADNLSRRLNETAQASPGSPVSVPQIEAGRLLLDIASARIAKAVTPFCTKLRLRKKS